VLTVARLAGSLLEVKKSAVHPAEASASMMADVFAPRVASLGRRWSAFRHFSSVCR
jgi:hypothetical protein